MLGCTKKPCPPLGPNSPISGSDSSRYRASKLNVVVSCMTNTGLSAAFLPVCSANACPINLCCTFLLLKNLQAPTYSVLLVLERCKTAVSQENIFVPTKSPFFRGACPRTYLL